MATVVPVQLPTFDIIPTPTLDILLRSARQQADDAVSYENWLRRHAHEEETTR